MLPDQIPAPASEIKALGDAIHDLIVDLKGKKSAAEVGGHLLQNIMLALPGAANALADVKKPEDQAFLGYAVLVAVEPQPVA